MKLDIEGKQMSKLTQEEYKELLQKYLQGHYETVESQLVRSTGNFTHLLQARLYMTKGNFLKTFSELNKVNLSQKTNLSFNENIQMADYYYLLGRNQHFINQPSKNTFLKAADVYFKINDLAALSRSLYNSLLDAYQADPYVQFKNEVIEIENNEKYRLALEKTYFKVQVQLLNLGLLLYEKKYSDAFDKYLEISFHPQFKQLPLQDQNYTHIYAIESALCLKNLDVIHTISKKIINPSHQIKETLNFFNSLTAIYYQQNKTTYDFDFSQILNSTRELFFEEEKRQAGLLQKEDAVKVKNQTPLFKKLVDLLKNQTMNKFALIEKIYGNFDSHLSDQNENLDQFFKNQKKIENLISRFNKSTNNYCIKIKNNTVGLYSKNNLQFTNRRDLLIDLLSKKERDLNSLILYFFFREEQTKSILDYKSTIYKLISEINENSQFQIKLNNHLYRIEHPKAS